MKNNHYANKLLIAALCSAATAAQATNGDQMLGVTATQWGMAGAVVAAPQDAGTILTNPAGLATLAIDEFRSDMGFGFLNPPRKVNGYESDSDLYMMPSGALAFRVNPRLSLGMGMAGLSGMGVDFADTNANPGNQSVVTTKQFYKIAPGFGFKVNEQLNIGAALNINYQSLAMYTPQFQLPQNQVFGFGASLGMTYQINPAMRLGAAYISKQSMDSFKWNTLAGRYEMTMDAPPSLQLGLAFMPSDSLLIEADIKQIWFSDVMDKITLSTPGGDQVMNFGWSDQTVYAIGVQKRVNPKTTMRLGYNYGASPIGPEDVKSNVGSLAVTEQHVTLGMTRQMTPKASVSMALMHAPNNKVTSTDGTTSIELQQNVFSLQISYRN